MNISNAPVTDSLEKLVRLLVFLFPIFFLTVRGWSNTIGALLLGIALIQMFRNPASFFIGRTVGFWFIFLALVTPFFAEVIVQVGRGSPVLSQLDGMSRFFYAAVVFTYLSRVNLDAAKSFSAGCVVSVIVSAASALLITDYYWDGRAATYFVDPITLPVFLVALLFCCGIYFFSSERKRFNSFLILVLIVLVFTVCLASSSRTAWVCLFVTALALMLIHRKSGTRLLFLGGLGIICVLGLLTQFSETFIFRMSSAYHEFWDFFLINEDYSSIGIRLGLLLIDWKLFVMNPIFGVADGTLPPYEWFADHGLLISEKLYRGKLLAGSHNEIMGHLSRSGVFGILKVICMFFFPIIYFARLLASETDVRRSIAESGFLFCFSIFLGGLAIQVTNLKMTSTFYAFALAIFLSNLQQKNHEE